MDWPGRIIDLIRRYAIIRRYAHYDFSFIRNEKLEAEAVGWGNIANQRA